MHNYSVKVCFSEKKTDTYQELKKHMMRIQKEGDYWWKNFISADEVWTYCYDPLLKRSSAQCVERGDAPPKKTLIKIGQKDGRHYLFPLQNYGLHSDREKKLYSHRGTLPESYNN